MKSQNSLTAMVAPVLRKLQAKDFRKGRKDFISLCELCASFANFAVKILFGERLK